MAPETPSRELLVGLARSVLDATSHLLPFEAAADTPRHVVWAGAFLARCRQLLSALATMVEGREDDAVGALYRTLLETYLSGIYALLGRDEALEVMRRALLHETHQLEVALGRTERDDRPEEAEKMPVSRYVKGDGLIERVDRLLAERDEQYRGWAPAIHRNHYRVLSLHDAHGGLGCLTGYIDTETGTPRVAPARGQPGPATFLLHHAIAHVGSLAGLWAMEVGHDASVLTAVLERWEAAQPDPWNPPSSD